MKRDLKINFNILEEIGYEIKKYKTALEEMEQASSRMISLLEESESKSVEELKKIYRGFTAEIKNCYMELEDLGNITANYTNEMQAIIKPINKQRDMRVDRNDIWFNMRSIISACESIRELRTRTAMNNNGLGLINSTSFGKSEEEIRREEQNYRKMADIWQNVIPRYSRKLNAHLEALNNIYHRKIVPFENKDDEYRYKASRLYHKYISFWGRIRTSLKSDIKIITDLIRGSGIALYDLVAGFWGLARGIVSYTSSAVILAVTYPFNATPQWAKEIFNGTNELISSIGSDPMLLVEGFAQQVSDTFEEEGAVFCIGYVAGDFLGGKGIEKLAEISKIRILKRSLDKVSDKTPKLSKDYYDKAGAIALKYDDLRTYSDHRVQHVKQVAEKSQKAADVIEKVVGKIKGYSKKIDRKELQVAALWHDTGMDGGSFRIYKTGKELRSDHSLNSAIHALERREELKELGVDADRIAVACMAHSKSCSGVTDLTSHLEWTECFKRIERAVEEYNVKYPDKPICFKKSSWLDETKDNGGIYIFKEEELEKTASTTAALRLGDANRDAPEILYTQGGEKIKVDPNSYNRKATDWKSEVETADVTITDANGEVINLRDAGIDDSGISRMFTAGESNLTHIDCVYNKATGSLTEEFIVKDGNSFPYSTQKCILERLEELDTIRGTKREVIIEIDGKYSPEMRKKIEESYGKYCEDQFKNREYLVKCRFKEDGQ